MLLEGGAAIGLMWRCAMGRRRQIVGRSWTKQWLLVGVICLAEAASPPHAAHGGWLESKRALVIRHVTGHQLEQTLDALRGKPDTYVAEQLGTLQLNERLNAAGLAHCLADLPGPVARQALTVLADQAVFLDPAAADLPSVEKPEIEAQRRMSALMVEYVNKTIRQLPNLFATRSTSSFEEDLSTDMPMRPVGRSSALVLFRNGEEELRASPVQAGGKKQHPELFSSSQVAGLTTSGEFGPILVTALLDAAHGEMAWSHWEQGQSGPEAVFRYAIAAGKSHYKVDEKYTGYRGEIAIDPATGTILRLVLRSDPQPHDPLVRADMVVEYGPVELGGRTYICPVRSVALSVARVVYAGDRVVPGVIEGRRSQTPEWINDVIFEQYHLYQASSRIVEGFTVNP